MKTPNLTVVIFRPAVIEKSLLNDYKNVKIALLLLEKKIVGCKRKVKMTWFSKIALS